jgi:transposase-like protein
MYDLKILKEGKILKILKDKIGTKKMEIIYGTRTNSWKVLLTFCYLERRFKNIDERRRNFITNVIRRRN